MNELEQVRQQIQSCHTNRELLPHWHSTLLGPLEDFFSRPRKDFRSKLLDLGFRLAQDLQPNMEVPQQHHENLEILKQILESLHSGSLIVDDIQDESPVRRGDQSLHLKYGTAIALNAGNWLYFLAFKLIEKLNVPSEKRLRIYSLVSETLFSAHFGQALDVGTTIDQLSRQEQIALCQKSLELKSGLLTGLAFELGALLLLDDERKLAAIKQFGVDFGICLQRFDDMGNLNCDRPTTKHLEDLALKRPSWVWHCLAEQASDAEVEQFKAAVNQIPEVEPLRLFLAQYDFKQKCFSLATQKLETVLKNLQTQLDLNPSSPSLMAITKLGEVLTHAYTK